MSRAILIESAEELTIDKDYMMLSCGKLLPVTCITIYKDKAIFTRTNMKSALTFTTRFPVGRSFTRVYEYDSQIFEQYMQIYDKMTAQLHTLLN